MIIIGSTSFKERVDDFQRVMIWSALEEAGHNQTRAARLLGLKRTTLILKLKTLKVYEQCGG